MGAGRIYSNLVVHPSVPPTIPYGEKEPWPLVETADDRQGPEIGGGNTIAFLSVIIWHHVNASYAVHFRGETVWRRAHTNRVDLSPGKYPAAYYNQPLNMMTFGRAGGQSRFWNFYQENWAYQGPRYRHLLVSETSTALRCYHCNMEHSEGEANFEIADTLGPVEIYGFKGEGNYVQIWVRNSSSFFLLGYGGNASPFPFNCYYPPGYAQYQPSIIRIESVASVRLANIVSQTGKISARACGVFDTGFAGSFYDPLTWRSILELPAGAGTNRNISTQPLHWPVLYKRLP